MTVTNTGYSSLEEVWGESFYPSDKKKPKKKKVVDPICELYEMGNNNGYTENDLVSFANSYYDKQEKNDKNERYEKSKFQRSMNDDVDHEPRERPVRNVAINERRNVYDVSASDDIEVEHHIAETSERVPKTMYKPTQATPQTKAYKNYHELHEDEEEPRNGFAFIDLLLYIVSGIILIFVMEQFVKIGLLLQ